MSFTSPPPTVLEDDIGRCIYFISSWVRGDDACRLKEVSSGGEIPMHIYLCLSLLRPSYQTGIDIYFGTGIVVVNRFEMMELNECITCF